MILFRYAWLGFVLYGWVVAAWWGARARPTDRDHRPAHRALVRGTATLGVVPWLIMGAGIELGPHETVFSFLLRSWNDPYILLFDASIVAVWIAMARWMWAGGADWIAAGNGPLYRGFTQVITVKRVFVAQVAGGALALVVMRGASLAGLLRGL